MNEVPVLSAVEVVADRVVLRRYVEADREGLIELQTDPEVSAYVGGPQRREDLEQHLDAITRGEATPNPNSFIIADKATNELLGSVLLSRRAADQPDPVIGDGGELELGYLLRRKAWGAGFAFEACAAALRAAAAGLPDQPVLLFTQTANKRSLKLAARLGFEQVGTFERYDAEQALCRADLHSFKA
jgi:RimJ/RimL family protein N-acetyltransferase